ncbi:DNA-binding transcriptional ArsR family regulator [Microbacterium testaceum]|uniref:SatD family protein n=1 Tax=Microbacterium TaxID=33882 RepID=UPI002782113B|nr:MULTISPECIES: SatD family protein [Microbacterium]MDQ1113304.1 DNA-binding transcriptional ArsR family regulator [Microbacterium testaceum]MDR6099596.1 DNA-binding transcriptional ArsR family regulator [Microbacterium sp. SORGH_AS_0454]
MTVAVIADIIASRRLDDRAGAQRAIVESVRAVQHDLPVAGAPLAPVVGDELQGEYDDLSGALASLLLLRLALPDDVDCRFGVGVGEVRPIELADRTVPEGPAWWAAREAIDHIERLQTRAAPLARTWIVLAEGQDATMTETIALARAYALSRDQLVSAMSERSRRLTYGRCVGRSQRELADIEGISQSAVSQALSAAGSAALVEGFAALTARVRS